MNGGVEWIIDVGCCAPGSLEGEGGLGALGSLFDDLIQRLDLHPLGPVQWHRFPGTDGLTGLVALSESHLACHTYPEAGALTLNLYTCRPRPAPDWHSLLEQHLGPCEVETRTVTRGIPEREATR